MTTKTELIKKYLEYSDEELLEISNNAEDYSADAREALTQVLIERGGFDAVKQRVDMQKEVEVLQNILREETRGFLKQGVPLDEIKNQASEKLESIPDMETVIIETYEDFIKEKEDKKVKPRTIIGGFTIRIFTRKSRKNIAVIIMTIVSVLYALLLGQIIYEVFGAIA